MSATLSNLEILALDCQATGANPARGHLLEVGWTRSRASSDTLTLNSAVQAYRVKLPADAAIPRAVQRITGISEATPEASLPAKAVWKHLLSAVGNAAALHPRAGCPLVIHFARFEEPFLRALHQRMGPPGPFPFQIICTHEIAVRLLPNLPRRGLRAVAGFYGHSMPELKRSADHALATAFVWQCMVRLLEEDCGITTPEQLYEWLAAPRPAGRSKRAFPMNPEIRRQLPEAPGIYRMLRSGGELLYIGKAKSLKQRVNSYFRPKAPHAEHILEMLTQARNLAVTRTESALEAAVLESDEIKRQSPPYNIALRQRQRQLVFCSKDLSRHNPKATGDYPVGPLLAGRTVEALRAFGVWLGENMPPVGGPDSSIGCAVLALPPEYAPESDCLKEGVEIFRRRHANRLNNQTPLGFITGLGARLWQAKLDAAALAEAVPAAEKTDDLEDLEAHPEDSGNSHTWTPEAVARAMEAVIRHSAHRIRRARWFCLVSESTLTWAAAGRKTAREHRVVLENGCVIQPDTATAEAGALPPPGFPNSFRRRQNNLDLVTYDRLRVLTTGIRRILSEGRPVELRLRPGVSLGRSELARALKWV